MKLLALLVLLGCASVDLTPMDLADQYKAQQWWLDNAPYYWGATWCYGKRSSVVRLSPQLRDSSEALRSSILAHEHVHQRQMFQLGCKVINRRAETPDGIVSIEAPAYRAQGISLLRTAEMLSTDQRLRLLPLDSIVSLVTTHWNQ